jgi:hypothetical protein
MSKVISVKDETYNLLAGATGRIMQMSQQPTSMSSTVDFSISITDNLLQRVLIDSRRNSIYRDQLAAAFKKKDREEVVRILIDSVKD